MGIQIILANGTTLSPKTASSTHVNFQNASRNALEFGFSTNDGTISFDSLRFLFTEYNCGTITLVDGDRKNQYTGYVLNVGISMKSVMVQAGDNENPPVYEDQYVVTMAQRTLIENQMSDIQKMADNAMLIALGAI